MIKVAVFDSGWGGELFADYLEEELPIFEIIRIIDWRNSPYDSRCGRDIFNCVNKAIFPFIGKVDLIVLACNSASIHSLEKLRKKYPNQKFIGFPFAAAQVSSDREARVLMLSTAAVFNSQKYQDFKLSHPQLEITELDCSHWVPLIDDGEMGRVNLCSELSSICNYNLVTLDCTHFIDIKEQIKNLCGWRAEVIDAYTPVMKEIRRELGLRGGGYARC